MFSILYIDHLHDQVIYVCRGDGKVVVYNNILNLLPLRVYILMNTLFYARSVVLRRPRRLCLRVCISRFAVGASFRTPAGAIYLESRRRERDFSLECARTDRVDLRDRLRRS